MHHQIIEIDSAAFHVVTAGDGPALLLLHGWPEFWLTWEPVIRRLSGRFRLIAPDLRGFGDSSKPAGPWGAADHAADLVHVLDRMEIGQVGIVGHDVGGAIMQSLARLHPARVRKLFFFDFVYPGIGPRMSAPSRLNEIWYQSFHQMPMAATMVGASRDTCRAYFTHFLRHWSFRKDAFDDVLDQFVDNFLKPGNLEGGFAYYRAAHAGRVAMMEGRPVDLPPIPHPTCVRWAEHDPLFPYAWTDRLGETFSDLDVQMFPGVGHFPHREDPDRAATEIARFFE